MFYLPLRFFSNLWFSKPIFNVELLRLKTRIILIKINIKQYWNKKVPCVLGLKCDSWGKLCESSQYPKALMSKDNLIIMKKYLLKLEWGKEKMLSLCKSGPALSL